MQKFRKTKRFTKDISVSVPPTLTGAANPSFLLQATKGPLPMRLPLALVFTALAAPLAAQTCEIDLAAVEARIAELEAALAKR